ncbi:NAD(P)-binding protein [Pyxidicoccus fallax]|uniref:NAD(P)-binding protein n=1 Tax=Pyxidicoccus fallax TaxID=394095 RepID=A0A848LFD4_9BACT|nr:FAD-dependent oxidoreductase [Pyxidicoccus fallax]NMO14268.1 NAD(P)-binding protein [Pyxidicoccus fallax]NPC82606.1 NAD(P)-binding protein [Pyxidicoccus fallax]
MGHLSSAELSHNQPIPTSVDILVVGAGMAGLYSTWRILREHAGADIAIFERSDRTGGRLDSDLIRFGDKETVKEEEGGMRFTFDLMDDLMSLLLLFGLDKEVVPFPMSGSGTNRLCFRGTSFDTEQSVADNYRIWSELYNLAPSEKGINPSTMIDTVFNRILAVNPNFKDRPNRRTPEFWQRFRLECQWNGVKLKDWSLWDLFISMGYSNECVQMLYALSGFNGTFLSRMNAGEAYQLLEDFPANPDFHTLENGFSTLPNALASSLPKERIHLNTEVTSIVGKERDAYVVRYTTKDKSGKLESGTIQARKLILAIPRLPLEKLFLRSPALNDLTDGASAMLWDTLQTTTNQALLKINLYYDTAWWGNNLSGQLGVGYGPNFSDLPLGSVYPFYAIDEATFAALEYSNWMQQRGEPIPEHLQVKLDAIQARKYTLPAALTIYCDYLNINFWKALQQTGPLFDSAMQREYSARQPQSIFAASDAVVETATRFFKQLFNTNYAPRPVMTSARIWDGSTLTRTPPAENFDFGVHQWGLHANDGEVIPYLVEPLKNLYTCGEAYSDYQGWVEGALRSADLVLAKAFKLKPISEVYREEHGVTPSEAMKVAYARRSAESIRKYIDPSFGGTQEKELAAAQGRRKPRHPHAVSLTYFDKP